MKLSIIAAVADNGVIGQAGHLPWHLPADLQHFKALTLRKPVLMGRRTWESIGRPLPGRRNLVITRDPRYRAPGVEVFTSLQAALNAVAAAEEAMVIGGAELYRALWPLVTTLFLTRVHATPHGDTYFPTVGPEWIRIDVREQAQDEKNAHAMTFEHWIRRA